MAGSNLGTTSRRSPQRYSAPSNGELGRAKPQETSTPEVLDTRTGIAEFVTLSQRTLDRLDHRVIAAIIDCLMDVWRQGRTVYVMGNGGSASTATHFAADLAKYTISAGKPRFKVLCLTDNV